MEKNKFYHVNTNYINYLKEYQNYIWNNDDKGHKIPYVGVVIKVGCINYYAPLTSPKKSNEHLKDSLTKIRIDNKGRFLGLINLKNMVPVNDEDVTLIDINQGDHKYGKLLVAQEIILRKKSNKIIKNANTLYKKVCNHPTDNMKLVERCYNFKLLEEKAKEYKIFQSHNIT